jgi:signal transduction histidine kinase
VNEYNLIRLRLVDNNLLLIQKNKSLVSLNKNIQQLSEKIIDVQEAVTNSIKYSQAENFSIDLTVEEKGIRLFRKYKNKD